MVDKRHPACRLAEFRCTPDNFHLAKEWTVKWKRHIREAQTMTEELANGQERYVVRVTAPIEALQELYDVLIGGKPLKPLEERERRISA